MDPYIGQITLFAFGFAPVGWFPCDGQILPIVQYQVLFAVIGFTFGGNGSTNFALPDLRHNTPDNPENKPDYPSKMQYCIAYQGIFPTRPY
jgi:microcystin-dependent protein